jgi:NAD(P)-dependent dehydrogenase (short-subunit alcohol dehydrogenase family)
VAEEGWDNFRRVDVKGAFLCVKRFAKELIRQGRGGGIINIASIAGRSYSGAAYAACGAGKGAVIAMTHIAAHQLGRVRGPILPDMPAVNIMLSG